MPRFVSELHVLRTEDGARFAAAWVFDRLSPAAVRLAIGSAGRPVEWVMGRSLVRDGLRSNRIRPAGEGDVRLHCRRGCKVCDTQPDFVDSPPPVLVVDLVPPDGRLRLFADAHIATLFLRATYELVPERKEQMLLSRQVDTAATWFMRAGMR